MVSSGVAAAVAPGGDAGLAQPVAISGIPSPAGAFDGRTDARYGSTSRGAERLELAVAADDEAAATPAVPDEPRLERDTEDFLSDRPPVHVVDVEYAKSAVKVRMKPSTKSRSVAILAVGTKVRVTGVARSGFRYVSYRGKGRWVTDRYLSDKKPKNAGGGVTRTPCRAGSGMEAGLTSDAILVHRTLCARYPQVKSFGGRRGGGGFHATGQAVDVMISNRAVGADIANWVRANARRLGVSEVIYAQHIWTVQRASEGWRPMSDRGSPTANHYDHVHVSVYGNRATG